MKKFIIGFTVVTILTLGGYYIFWEAQVKKLENVIERTIKAFNKGDDKENPYKYNIYVNISHDKIKKSGFPFKINLKIPNIVVDTKSPIYDFDLYNKNHSEEKSNTINPSGMSILKTSIEEGLITSDLMLKKIFIQNIKLIRYEDNKGEISIIDSKPILKFFLKDDIINNNLYTTVDLLSITDKLKSVEYSDNGYKVYNEKNVLKEQSDAQNLMKIDNLSDSTNFNFEFFASYHNKNNKRYEKLDGANIKNKTEQIFDFLGYSDLDLDLSFKSNRLLKDNNNLPQSSESYLFNFDIKKLNWDFLNSGLKIDGKFTASDKDMFIPVGIMNYMFLNYNNLFDSIIDLNPEDDNKMIEALRKILPEIANEISNNDLKIIYSRKEGDQAMIGKKNFEEFAAEYQNYIEQKQLEPELNSSVND